MVKKTEVIELHSQRPEMTAAELAAALGCSPEYIRKTAARCGLKLASARPMNNDPVALRAEAKRLLWRVNKLLLRARDLEARGE